MSDAQMHEFDQRLQRIDRRHQLLARGFALSVSKDGLIVARPQRDSRRFPWRGLLMVLVAVLGFKAMLYAQIGAEDYNARIATLSAGSVVEQIGAYAMAADPFTVWLASAIQGN